MRSIRAIYDDGVFKPLEQVDLPAREPVRILYESVRIGECDLDRNEVFKRIRERVARMNFRSSGPYPSRDEHHDRH